MKYLSEAIIDFYGYKEGLETKEGVVTAWPYSEPQPSAEDLEVLRTAFEAVQEVRDARARDYPPLADQLDMIYHDRANGTATWDAAIAAVKAKHPKP